MCLNIHTNEWVLHAYATSVDLFKILVSKAPLTVLSEHLLHKWHGDLVWLRHLTLIGWLVDRMAFTHLSLFVLGCRSVGFLPSISPFCDAFSCKSEKRKGSLNNGLIIRFWTQKHSGDADTFWRQLLPYVLSHLSDDTLSIGILESLILFACGWSLHFRINDGLNVEVPIEQVFCFCLWVRQLITCDLIVSALFDAISQHLNLLYVGVNLMCRSFIFLLHTDFDCV